MADVVGGGMGIEEVASDKRAHLNLAFAEQIARPAPPPRVEAVESSSVPPVSVAQINVADAAKDWKDTALSKIAKRSSSSSHAC